MLMRESWIHRIDPDTNVYAGKLASSNRPQEPFLLTLTAAAAVCLQQRERGILDWMRHSNFQDFRREKKIGAKII
jgi:hypothetical protein